MIDSSHIDKISELGAASWIRPPLATSYIDPIAAWIDYVKRICESIDQQSMLFSAVSFDEIFEKLHTWFPAPSMAPKPNLRQFNDALWVKNLGGLFDGQTGQALPDSYVTRFPRQQQHPYIQELWIDLKESCYTAHGFERCVFIPSVDFCDFSLFSTEGISRLWPFVWQVDSSLSGLPVIVQSMSDAKSDLLVAVFRLLRRCRCYPILSVHLPEQVHLRDVLIPQPAFVLQSFVSDTHLLTANAIGGELFADENRSLYEEQSIVSGSKVFLLDDITSSLPCCSEIINSLRAHGWFIQHQDSADRQSFLEQLSEANVICGFDSELWYATSLVKRNISIANCILLGENPSVDLMLLLAAQNMKGYFVPARRLDFSLDFLEKLFARLKLF